MLVFSRFNDNCSRVIVFFIYFGGLIVIFILAAGRRRADAGRAARHGSASATAN